ncbi:MAG: hypothetical protein AABY18_03520 [Candidatus Thermoplasmatota archaeon]
MVPRPRNAADPPTAPDAPLVRIVVPVRMAAWMSGDLGTTLERTLLRALEPLGPVKVTRLPRAFLVESDEAPGPFLEAVQRAAVELEQGVAAAYPVFHHEIGPVWTGTLQAVFPPQETALTQGQAL